MNDVLVIFHRGAFYISRVNCLYTAAYRISDSRFYFRCKVLRKTHPLLIPTVKFPLSQRHLCSPFERYFRHYGSTRRSEEEKCEFLKILVPKVLQLPNFPFLRIEEDQSSTENKRGESKMSKEEKGPLGKEQST